MKTILMLTMLAVICCSKETGPTRTNKQMTAAKCAELSNKIQRFNMTAHFDHRERTCLMSKMDKVRATRQNRTIQ